MGTRHIQTVINKKGEVKVLQYGQWDGYPNGQGIEILDFLNNSDLNKYEESLADTLPVTQEKIDEINTWIKSLGKNSSDDILNKNVEYYALSRDCGSNIHSLIYNKKIKYVTLDKDGGSWCEGFYDIDFQKNTFTTEFHDYKVEYNLDKLPTESEYLADYNNWKKENNE